MFCHLCIVFFVCAYSAVVAMPNVSIVDAVDNEVHSYNFTFVRREQWRARAPIGRTPLLTPVPFVIIHNSHIPPPCYDRKDCDAAMRLVQNMEMDFSKGWDIGFNFGVGSDGAAYEGRGWRTKGVHTFYFNNISIGITLIGGWSFETPPVQQLKTTKALIEAGVKLGFIQADYKLLGHRQVRSMECPGLELFKEIQTWPHYLPFPDAAHDPVDVSQWSAILMKHHLANATED